MLLEAQIGGHPEILFTEVHAEVRHGQLRFLAIHGGVAVAARHVQTNAEAAVVGAVGHIGGGVALAAALGAQGHLVECPVRRALGHDVDGAAQATAARRRALQEGVGATEHLHPLDELRRQVLARQQAVQAVIGDVVRIHRQAAHQVHLLVVAEAARHPHRRVVEQDLADAGGLLVFDQLFGVVGDVVGGLHNVLGAEDADAAAFRHLAAGVGRAQAALGGIGAGLHLHRGQGVAAAAFVVAGLRVGAGKGAAGKNGEGKRGKPESRKAGCRMVSPEFELWVVPGRNSTQNENCLHSLSRSMGAFTQGCYFVHQARLLRRE